MSNKSQVEPRAIGHFMQSLLHDQPKNRERALLIELRRQGYELARDWLAGPRGRYEHRRVIRRRGAA